LFYLIGNQAYATEIGRLSNPHNDIALLERTLRGLGFEVATVRDAGLATLHQSINAYVRRIQAAGPNVVGFFYYSGHGASDGNTNYLIPVDVKTTEAGELWDQSLRLTKITRKLKAETGNATHFVVFDACRNTLKLTQPGSRAVVQSKGFVPVTQESGMLIAYATAEGELASDVGAGAGPYAKVLSEEVVKPGVEAVAMFRVVQRRVRVAIRQEPYLGFSALGDVYLGGKLDAAVAPQPALPRPVTPPAPGTRESCNRERATKSTSVNKSTEITFVNSTGMAVRLNWLDYEGKRVLYGNIPEGQTVRQPTFTGHPWVENPVILEPVVHAPGDVLPTFGGMSVGLAAVRPQPTSWTASRTLCAVRLKTPSFLAPKKALLIPTRAAMTMRSPDMRAGLGGAVSGNGSRVDRLLI
jgi:hypothetical protein